MNPFALTAAVLALLIALSFSMVDSPKDVEVVPKEIDLGIIVDDGAPI